MMRELLPLVLLMGCGGDVDSSSNPLQPADCARVFHPPCPCGSPLTTEVMAESGSFDQQLAEFSDLACDAFGPALRGECSDGKTLLYMNGGFGHTALYYFNRQLVGKTWSSDVRPICCPATYYNGELEDVTCELVRVESLCPSSTQPIELTPNYFPYADGQLSPWCDPVR
jgi:hypothetical protein